MRTRMDDLIVVCLPHAGPTRAASRRAHTACGFIKPVTGAGNRLEPGS